MKMIEQDLQGLGFTEGESKAYIAMLELGSTTVGPIAKKASIAYLRHMRSFRGLLRRAS